MKSFILAALVLIATPVFASQDFQFKYNNVYVTENNQYVTNNTNVYHPVQEVDHNSFDYGVAGDVVLYETPNTEWGARADYLHESSETRVYAYGKIYLNRMTYQKR